MQRFYEWRCKFSQKAVSAVAAFFAGLEPSKQNAAARKTYVDLALGQESPFLYAANNPDVRLSCCGRHILMGAPRYTLAVGSRRLSSQPYLSIL